MTSRREILAFSVPAVALMASSTVAMSAPRKASGGINRTQYDRYVALYNAADPKFGDYYHDNVVMETVPPLTSRDQILNFRKELSTYLIETMEVEYYVNDKNGSAAQVVGQFECVRDMPITAFNGLFGRAVKKGQVLRQRGALLYGVSDAKFKWIRAFPPIILQDWS